MKEGKARQVKKVRALLSVAVFLDGEKLADHGSNRGQICQKEQNQSQITRCLSSLYIEYVD